MPAEREVKIIIKYGVQDEEKVEKGKKIISGLSHEVDKTAEVARKFAKDWGVSFDKAYDYINKLGLGVEKSSKKMGYHLTFIAWHFRYLGNIFDRIGKQMMRTITDTIKTSAELQESFLSIRTAAIMYGQSAEKATQLTKDLALTGLMPLTDAANSVKNLMITGIGMPEMEKFTYRYLDVAFLMTSGMDEMQKSLEVMSKSILRGTLVLSQDVTARMLWTETEKRLQRTMGISMKDLSARQKLLQILTTIEEKYAATLGFHRMETETTRAALNRLNTSVILIKNALGEALLPLLNAVIPVMVRFSAAIEGILKTLGPVIPVVVGVGLAVAFFTSKIAFAMGILLSFIKIARFASFAMWKFYLPVLAISAIVAGGAYLFMKYSGALDKAQQSAVNIDKQLESLKKSLEGINTATEDSIEIDEDKRIAHERAVEDIMEDLEREKSKGLWANQMAIQDLEKRLKRENEDWNRYIKGRGTQTEEESGLFGDLMGSLDELGVGIDTTQEKFKISFENIIEGIKKVTRIVAEEFGKLPPIVQGIFAGIATYLAITWLASIIKTISAFVAGATAKFAAVGGAWGLLAAAISTPLAIAILVGAAVAAIAMVRNEYQLLVDQLTRGTDEIMASQNRLITQAKEMYETGKIGRETYMKILEDQKKAAEDYAKTMEEIGRGLGWSLKAGWELFKAGLPGFQFGGMVPGMRNQPVPILAHGGERIIPAGETAGGNITININNPIVREQGDINRIARAVSAVLGQRQRFSRLGAI